MKQLNIITLIIILLTFSLLSAELTTRSITRRGTDRLDHPIPDPPPRGDRRDLIPPLNLTATVVDLVNVQLNWDTPTDLIRISYHDNTPVDGYYQESVIGYGTVFDLTAYPEATLEYLDFRHSPWGLNGTWEYEIHIIDWDDGTLLAIFEDMFTTLNNGWETDIYLNSILSVESVGIFLVPLGNDPMDAYPVFDLDSDMDGASYLINVFDYSLIEQAIGDFLMDLWIREGDGPATRISSYDISESIRKERPALPLRQELQGYKIYRNDNLIDEIPSPDILSYLDEDLFDGTYTYYVTADYDEGESEPSNTVTVTINTGIQIIWSDNFESYPDFVTDFPPWTLIDIDGSNTYGFNNITFPGEYQPMAYIIFNPSQTTPPMTDLIPPSGEKMAASFSSDTAQTNNWMITPLIELGTESSVTFKARSYTSQYGLERFRVGISTTDSDPGSFSIITPGQYVQAPVAWTEFTYDLSEYDEQSVYMALNCVSNYAFVFFVDDFKVLSIGEVSVDDEYLLHPAPLTARNYPNPFNPETTIEFNISQSGRTKLEIFNIKGQKIALLLDEYLTTGTHMIAWSGRDNQENEVTSGIYFYRLTTTNDNFTGKMMLLK
ncbi:MAG: choice-of-anchor J domain-containing protein [Candidatus Cloacimonetes bacterium]|nr:choice-of-anchor J domain-containing protein [Candidatus Cloacimonadota bacterium]